MSLIAKKTMWLTFYFVILLSGPFTVFLNTPFSSVSDDSVSLINFFQRISGLLLFNLLFMQIMLGSLMNVWTQVVGSKAYSTHIAQGVAIYALALFHPLMQISIIYKISGSFSTALKAILPLISSQEEIYLTYAKTALVILTLTVGAAYFRTKPFFRKNWRYLHWGNYAIFFLIYLHMRVGSDITTPPFLWVSWIALAGVSFSLLNRVYPFLIKTIKTLVRS